jgi:hypothetical protein
MLVPSEVVLDALVGLRLGTCEWFSLLYHDQRWKYTKKLVSYPLTTILL